MSSLRSRQSGFERNYFVLIICYQVLLKQLQKSLIGVIHGRENSMGPLSALRGLFSNNVYNAKSPGAIAKAVNGLHLLSKEGFSGVMAFTANV